MPAGRDIQKAISRVVKVGMEEIHLEHPELEEHGDYATNVALKFKIAESKPKTTKKTNPKVLAEEIAQSLRKDKVLAKTVSKIEVAGPGFINFFLKKEYLIKELQSVLKKREDYGRSAAGQGKVAIIEYSSPNIAKPFTVGHLRSTIIGDAIANLFEATGWKVFRDNHLGDWGTQFGKQIYAIKTWGNEDKIEASKNPVKELVALYVKFHQELKKKPELAEKGREWFKKLEEGDKEARRLWRKCVDWSWKEFDRIYELLGVKFSQEFDNGRGLGESFFEDKIAKVVEELKKKDLLQVGEKGAKLVFFKNDKYPPAMILKKDGTTLYHTRDLATDKFRLEKFGRDILIINEVGAEQTLYFRQLFEIEKLLGWFGEGHRVHVAHGLYRFKDTKMSTRKGNVIWLEEVLSEAKDKAMKLAKDSKAADKERLAEVVGIGSIKWNDLKRDPKSSIIFDWDEILNMQGNSGPYLQYTFARTQSVVRKARKQDGRQFKRGDMKLEPEEISLLRSLSKFPEVVAQAAEKYAPNLLCHYLYDLAQKYNLFYNRHRIIGDQRVNTFRLLVTGATGQILKNGLSLLGIETPEKM